MAVLKSQYLLLLYETKNSQLRKDAAKKKVMIMRNETEILKQKSSLTSGINIKLVLVVALVGVLVWALASVTVSFGWVVALLAFYLLFRLVWRIIKLIIKLIFSILFLLLLISLISLFIL